MRSKEALRTVGLAVSLTLATTGSAAAAPETSHGYHSPHLPSGTELTCENQTITRAFNKSPIPVTIEASEQHPAVIYSNHPQDLDPFFIVSPVVVPYALFVAGPAVIELYQSTTVLREYPFSVVACEQNAAAAKAAFKEKTREMINNTHEKDFILGEVRPRNEGYCLTAVQRIPSRGSFYKSGMTCLPWFAPANNK